MLTFDQTTTIYHFDSDIECIVLLLSPKCSYWAQVSLFHPFQTGKVVHHDKLAPGRVETRRIYEVMKHSYMQ